MENDRTDWTKAWQFASILALALSSILVISVAVATEEGKKPLIAAIPMVLSAISLIVSDRVVGD